MSGGAQDGTGAGIDPPSDFSGDEPGGPAGALARLPPLREVIARHDLRADKALGQNFLLDSNITDKIARAAGDLRDVTAIEIGPGPGGLTRSLLRAGAKAVVAVEFDPRAVGALRELEDAAGGRLRIVQADALATDLTALVPAGRRAIVANLPYNIATPLLLGWLAQLRADAGAYESMTLMFQREVADRLTAPAGGKAYGRLAVMAQWLCAVKRLFDLPPSVFVPPPKIKSSVVGFRPRLLDGAGGHAARDDAPDGGSVRDGMMAGCAVPGGAPAAATVAALTAAAFGQRRKMLRSSLRGWPGLLAAAGVDETLRAEQLDVATFIRMARLAEANPALRPGGGTAEKPGGPPP